MLTRVPSGRARPAGLSLAALAAIAAGYADLARGGTTAASLLLVLGYGALVPAALWLGVPPAAGRRSANADDHRPPYGAAACVALAALALYVAGLAPTTAMWDTSEYIAAAHVLGLPHPPGNPFFVLLAHAVGLIPVGGYAQRINFLVALASASAAGLWFLVADRVLARWIVVKWRRVTGAAAASLIGATAFTVWNQSVVAEKVYPVSLAMLALVSWIAVRWSHDPDGPGADRRVVLAAYLTGLGYAVHPAGFLALPALGAAVLARRARLLLKWRLVVCAAGAIALGVSVFAFEPIRAAHFPALDEGEPTACATHFAWSCTFDHVTLDRLRANIDRDQYAKPPVLERQAPFGAQLGMLWLYFRWQWLRDAYGAHPAAQTVLALLFLALGAAGGVAHWRHDRESFWYVGTLVATLTVALVFYLNFKYGWSQARELGASVPREVRDRDYFFMWTFSLWGVWAGVGLVALWRALAARVGAAMGERRGGGGRDRAWLLAAPALAIAFIPLVANAGSAPRAGQTFTREWARDLLESVEPYGILITGGDNDTFPLWYAQRVEGIRRDVTVVVPTYLQTDWFVRQLIRTPVPAYDAARGPAIYRGRRWPRPTTPPLALTLAQADSVPDYIELRGPARFEKGALSATIRAGIVTRDQLMVLRFIKDSFPERPLYFAESAGGYPDALGLGPYLLQQGLARKLTAAPVVASQDTVATPYGHLDVRRTLALWDSVYHAPRALSAQRGWVDRASVGLPLLYASVGAELADAMSLRGDTARARTIMATAMGIARSTRLDGLFGAPAEPVAGGDSGTGNRTAGTRDSGLGNRTAGTRDSGIGNR